MAALFMAAALAWFGVWQWQARQAPSAAESHLEEGGRQFRAGRSADAEREWLRAVELDPGNVPAWEVLGDYYLSTGQWPPALQAYAAVSRLQPATPAVWTKMARAATNTGDAPVARRCVDEALKRDPNDVEALNILTTLLKRGGEDAQRIEVLQRLVKLKPDDATLLTKAADAMMRRKRFADAAPLVERILVLDPNSSSALAMQGAIAFNDGASPQSLRKAVADFQKAIGLNPSNWVARWYLGRSYLRLNRPADAIAALKLVDATHPENKNYLNDLAAAYQQSGDAAQASAVRQRFAVAERSAHAITELRSRLGAAPDDFSTNLQLGLLLLQSKNADGAARMLDKALRIKPQSAEAKRAVQLLEEQYRRSLQSGLRSLKARNKDQAMLHLSRALQLRPEDARTRLAVQQLAAASQISFYQAVFELEHLPES